MLSLLGSIPGVADGPHVTAGAFIMIRYVINEAAGINLIISSGMQIPSACLARLAKLSSLIETVEGGARCLRSHDSSKRRGVRRLKARASLVGFSLFAADASCP